MAISNGRYPTRLETAVGLAVSTVAIVGTHFLGWEWNDGRFLPAMIGVVAAAVAVVVILNRRS